MLKIKDNVDLKELEKFGFEKTEKKGKTQEYLVNTGEEEYYYETFYFTSNGRNSIEILESRDNSDWKHLNIVREIYIYEDDYEAGISKNTFKLIMFAKPNWFEWKTWEWIKT